ncbi:MAG: hypothetical protein M1812_002364 [Candelaria pacifica]|nr:MAG: hypothetical protein M1812_002364 [Candelaria pacifica]
MTDAPNHGRWKDQGSFGHGQGSITKPLSNDERTTKTSGDGGSQYDANTTFKAGAPSTYLSPPTLGSGNLEGNNFGRGIFEEELTASPSAGVGAFPNNPAYPFNFDWDSSFEAFTDFTKSYDPQGELVDELNRQQPPVQDFSIPQPLVAQAHGVSSFPLPSFTSSTGVASHAAILPPPPPSVTRTSSKRKSGSEPTSAMLDKSSITGSQSMGEIHASTPQQNSKTSPTSTVSGGGMTETQLDKRPNYKRSKSTSTNTLNIAGLSGPTTSTASARGPTAATRRSTLEPENQSAGRLVGVHRPDPADVPILPSEKVFPIQIGSELFRLSGASLSSDAPSYFSQFFEEQLRQNEDGAGGVRTLYIDRDPVTFQDISRHLQGYHVQPQNGSHYVKLFADAQFYSLPRLISQLHESEIFIEIGHRHFQIPRDIFSGPGDSPNFFSLGFAVFFSSPGEVFPGLDRKGLLRPPSIAPPSVPTRSAEIFAQLLHMLRGYPLHIRDQIHRAELLRDCRYFHLRGLEQKLIPHEISFNLKRNRSEIVIRLEDVRQSGVSFAGDVSPADRSPLGGWVNYARPFVDEKSYELVLEIGSECTKIDFRSMRADFHGQAKARISSLFQVVANKMNLPTNQPLGLMMMSSGGGVAAQPVSPGNTGLSEDQVKIRIERDAHVLVDGEPYWTAGPTEDLSEDENVPINTGAAPVSVSRAGSTSGRSAAGSSPGWPPQNAFPTQVSRPPSTRPPPRKRKRRGSLEDFGEWIVRKGQWRLRIQSAGDIKGGMEVVLVAVKLDALSGERGRNSERVFLSG